MRAFIIILCILFSVAVYLATSLFIEGFNPFGLIFVIPIAGYIGKIVSKRLP
jgi:hypothetical protein